MEVSLKIIFVLYLCTLSSCVKFFPSLEIKPPVNLNFDTASLSDIFRSNSENVRPNDSSTSVPGQCFCFPNNSNNALVTENLGPKQRNLERLVVYFYKNNGLLKMFIPNARKQIMIPDLTFDKIDGDVLKPVFLETAAEVFDSSSTIILKDQKSTPDKETDENETAKKEIDILKDVLNDEAIQAESIKKEVNIDTIEQGNQSNETSDVANDNTKPPENKDVQTLDNDYKPPSHKPEQAQVSTLPSLDNLEDLNHLRQFIALLPSKTRAYFESLMPQLQTSYPGSTIETYLTFDKWFKGQLRGMMVQNLVTPSRIDALKNRIIKVLRDNGMFVSKTGMLLDSQGNVLKMSNIRLRPILIGDPALAPLEISYLQVFLVTQIDPANILGVVPMGKVYLPSTSNTIEKVKMRSGLPFSLPVVGCKNCKAQSPPIIGTQSLINAIPFFQIPFSKIESDEREASMRQLSIKPQESTGQSNPEQPNRRPVYDEGGNIIQRLFGIPRIIVDNTQRLIGGSLLNMPKIGPKPTLNDDLPGFRIIGGQPATSSGTPLVSKGRSGYEFSY